MSKDGLYTDGSEQFAPKVNAIPLNDVDSSRPGEASLGLLVSNATEQMSSLFRSELELAKTELAASAKKGAVGGGLFGVAGTLLLYSSFFFFFFLAELLADLWLARWAAFLVVFLIMVVLAGLVAFIGLRAVKKIKAPEKTIESVKDLKKLRPGQANRALEQERGLYT